LHLIGRISNCFKWKLDFKFTIVARPRWAGFGFLGAAFVFSCMEGYLSFGEAILTQRRAGVYCMPLLRHVFLSLFAPPSLSPRMGEG